MRVSISRINGKTVVKVDGKAVEFDTVKEAFEYAVNLWESKKHADGETLVINKISG